MISSLKNTILVLVILDILGIAAFISKSLLSNSVGVIFLEVFFLSPHTQSSNIQPVAHTQYEFQPLIPSHPTS